MNAYLTAQTQNSVKPKLSLVTANILQRACACGQHTSSSGSECEECKKKRQGMLQRAAVNSASIISPVRKIQTKLAINRSGDEYEQEADRIADEIIVKPSHTNLGGVPPHVQHFVGHTSSQTSTAPASVNQVLASPGMPLEPAMRQDMEQRFGYDFSHVRVHSDSSAQQSVQDVNAIAYAVGRDVVFGAGRYQPGTTRGKHLLAHELTHVMQQTGHGHTLQRFAACESAENCPRRDPREAEGSRNTPHSVEIYQPTTFGILISNFAINDHRVKPDLFSNATWLIFAARIGSTAGGEWEILGFTDCEGDEGRNRSLRDARAASVASMLASTAAGQVIRVGAAPIRDCISSNQSKSDRGQNRAVIVRRLPGSRGPAAPVSPGPIGPVRPPGSPGDFCVPYTGVMGSIEAAAARTLLERVWLPYTGTVFGSDVQTLWRDYLSRPKGSSLAPRVFRGRGNQIVDAFETDPETVRHRGLLYAEIQAAAAQTPEANVPFTGTNYTSPPIALGTLLPATSLSRIINYTSPATDIPGNIAGGTSAGGASSSDAGPDLRLFTGSIQIRRRRTSPILPEVKTVQIDLQLQVIDAVDFCPGAAGGSAAQQFTIPMSRLEATPTETTYDLPFHVFVDLSGTAPLP